MPSGSTFDDPAASLRLYRSVINSMAEGVVVQDGNGVIVSANQQALAILGVSLDQLCGRTSLDPSWRAVYPDGRDFPGDEHPAMCTLRTGRPCRDVVMGVHLPDGALRWISINTSPIAADRREADGTAGVDPAGAVVEGVVATFHDITAQRAASSALTHHAVFADMMVDCLTRFAIATVQSADEALRQALSQAAACLACDHVFVIELSAGRSRMTLTHEYCAPHVSPIAADYQDVPVTGFSSTAQILQDRSVLRNYLEDISDPDERAVHAREGARRALRVPIRTQGGIQGAVAFHRHRTDTLFETEDERHARIFGRAVGAFLERINAERQRHNSEARYHLIADNTEDVIWLYNVHDRCIEYVSPSVERLTGLTPAEVQARDFDRFLDPGSTPAFTTAVQACIRAVQCGMSEGRTVTCEVQLVRREGPPVPVEVVVNVVQDTAGHVTHVQGVARDVRRRLELEQQLAQAQKLESIGRLAGGVAHDFNNMLTVIISEADLALNDLAVPDSSVGHALQAIATAAQKSADLTRQLLAFARRQTTRAQVVELNDQIRSTLKMLQRLIGEDIQLQFTPGPGAYLTKIDPSQVDQILANLSVNARDAMSGHGHIAIATRVLTLSPTDALVSGLAAGEYCEIEFSDTGIGMPPDVMARIFDPFYTTKEPGQGTGLGLSTVYGIATQNHGTVLVHSEVGRGSTFRILLPRDAEAAGRADAPVQAALPEGHETILIVEDEKAILSLAERILGRQGYRVLTASHPTEAIAAVTSHPVDLVLSDVVMPEMNGFALRDVLVARRPGLRYLFMSGYSADTVARRGEIPEDSSIIQKPFDRMALTRAVREAIDRAPRS